MKRRKASSVRSGIAGSASILLAVCERSDASHLWRGDWLAMTRHSRNSFQLPATRCVSSPRESCHYPNLCTLLVREGGRQNKALSLPTFFNVWQIYSLALKGLWILAGGEGAAVNHRKREPRPTRPGRTQDKTWAKRAVLVPRLSRAPAGAQTNIDGFSGGFTTG